MFDWEVTNYPARALVLEVGNERNPPKGKGVGKKQGLLRDI